MKNNALTVWTGDSQSGTLERKGDSMMVRLTFSLVN